MSLSLVEVQRKQNPSGAIGQETKWECSRLRDDLLL